MRYILICLILASGAGCAANLHVSKVNDSNNVRGIPFHVLKPYKVTGALRQHTSKKPCKPVPFMKVVMWPSADELYQLELDPSALGKTDFSVEFSQDGTLRKVTLNSDPKFSENLRAVTDFVKGAVLPFAGPRAFDEQGPTRPEPAIECNTGEVIDPDGIEEFRPGARN